MITVGVVVPTMDGRQVVLEQALDALSATLPPGYTLDVTVPSNYPSCGEAWNEGRKDVDGQYLYFMSDDIVLHPGWLEVCVETVEAGCIPAAKQLHKDGTLEGCGSMGYGHFLGPCADWTPVRNTGILFVEADWYDRVVGEFLPIHYAADDDWTWRALLHGIRCAHRHGYTFTHHAERTATHSVRQQAPAHIKRYVENAARQTFTYAEYEHE